MRHLLMYCRKDILRRVALFERSLLLSETICSDFMQAVGRDDLNVS